MKLCSPSGTRPVKSAANHAISSASSATIPHSATQMKCGIASSSRKKTVSRFRFKSSVTISPIG